MKRLLIVICFLPLLASAQSEDDFLPELSAMVLDSTEVSVQKFCKEITAHAPGYKPAFVDREDVMMSTYFYDSPDYESLKLEFQFGIDELLQPDSTYKKKRTVKLLRITCELNVMTSIYNYLFNTSHTPDKIMTISRYDKAVTFGGAPINSTLIADDYKAGYWILSFYKLK